MKLMQTKWMYAMLMVCLLGSQAALSAQNKENKVGKEKKQRPTQEQVMQMQTEQMVRTLMLDDATAAKFVPLYGSYLKELRECQLMTRKPKKEKADAASPAKKEQSFMTDSEIDAMLRAQFAQGRKIFDIREAYYEKFTKILSMRQMLKLYRQEMTNADKFRKEFDRRKKLQKPGQGNQPEEKPRVPRQKSEGK